MDGESQRDRRHGARRDDTPSPLTLGQALAARVRLIVWCKACQHKVEPDIATHVERYGDAVTVIDWAARLRCSKCGDMAANFRRQRGEAVRQ